MGGTNCAHDAFADAGDDRLFSCAANEAIEMRPHRNTRFHFYADAILRDAINRCAAHGRIRRVNDLGINACAHGFQHRLAGAFCGQVDSTGPVEIERNACLISGD